MIFDTHAHYDDEQFDTDREALLASFPDQGIGCVVNVGANIASTKASMELTERYPFIMQRQAFIQAMYRRWMKRSVTG